MTDALLPTTLPAIDHAILEIRGCRVMLDADLAALYGVPTGRLVEAVKRHPDRFPADFMFQLTKEEHASLLSQTARANGRGGRRTAPYAFTEQGVAMLSSVLNSARAVAVNIEVIRAFVRMRRLLDTNADLAARIDLLEERYDQRFEEVFEAIRELMAVPAEPTRRIGFALE